VPFAASILVFPYLFFLFRVYRNGRLASPQEFCRLGIDVFKLRIAVRMRGTFFGLAVGLQAEFLLVQQFRNQHVATRCPWAHSSSARFRTLLHVHRSGD
jgi:hypothetical protein